LYLINQSLPVCILKVVGCKNFPNVNYIVASQLFTEKIEFDSSYYSNDIIVYDLIKKEEEQETIIEEFSQ
jgi:hypothetical protein